MTFLIISSLIALSIFTTSVCFILVYSVGSHRNKVAQLFKGELINTLTIDLAEINTIEIECFQEDIYFVQAESNDLIINEYRYGKENNELATVTKEADKLIITAKDTGIPNSKKFYSREEFCIPVSYSGNLAVTVKNGNIHSEMDLSLNQLRTSSQSGDIRFKEVTAEIIEVSTQSGLVAFDKVEGKRIFHSSSGYIKISGGSGDSEVTSLSGGITMINTSGLLNVTSSSGGLLITSLKGGGIIHTNSGRIDYTLQEVTESVNINSNNGDVTVRLPENSALHFMASSTSGNIKTFFEGYLTSEKANQVMGSIGENPTYAFGIATVSGDINVSRY